MAPGEGTNPDAVDPKLSEQIRQRITNEGKKKVEEWKPNREQRRRMLKLSGGFKRKK